MKIAIFQRLMISVLVIIGMLSSCKKESSESKPNGSVKFLFQNEVSEQKLKSTKTDSVPMPVAIIVSIETTNGEVLYDKEKLELINLDGKYITKALNMKAGTYNLTEFMVIDANNTIIYATPKKGSKMESLVNKPLPLNFQISSNDINILKPEVIIADGNSPDDFGYASFTFNFVKTIKFLVSVIYKSMYSGELTSTSANITVNGEKTKLDHALNQVYVKDNASEYIVNIWQSGYFPWTDTLTATQLLGYVDSPLIVYLKPYDVIPSFISFQTSFIGKLLPVIQTDTPQKFYLEWGCGVSEVLTSRYITKHSLSNCKGGDHLIKIWGPVQHITSISMGMLCFTAGCAYIYGPLTNYSSMDIREADNLDSLSLSGVHLTSITYNSLWHMEGLNLRRSDLSIPLEKFTNLKYLAFSTGNGGYLDISKNTELITLDIVSSLDSISFGDSKLTDIHIFNDEYNSPDLNTVQFNKILVDLLANVKKTPRIGAIYCNITPNLEGADAKESLIKDYGWTFAPKK